MITFRCDCGQQLKVKDEHAGRKVKCPGCDQPVRVPQPEDRIDEEPRRSVPSSKHDSRKPPPSRNDEAEERRVARADESDDRDEVRRSRSRPRAEDDDDDSGEDDFDRAPIAAKQAAEINWLLIGVIAACVTVLAGAAVVIYMLTGLKDDIPIVKKKDKDQTPVIQAKKDPAKVDVPKTDPPKTDPPKTDLPKNDPPKKDPPKTEDPAALALRRKLENNLKQLGLAMHNFHSIYGKLPPQGFSGDVKFSNTKPLLSWRVAVLPFIEEDKLYREFKLNEAWDSPHNIKLLGRMPAVFQAVGGQPKKDGHTLLQVVTGPGTAYPTATATPIFPKSFPDGTSNTILIVEAAEPLQWTKPADFMIDVTKVTEGSVPKLGGFRLDGFFANLADGSVRFIERPRTSDKTIRQAFNPADGMPFGPDW
ncbi:MAG: DUF1559 domain-containing protein [Planctomycetes bacterium]|nr:DUF1559 domain-containing protein [Planctomycetota bacterium]